MKNASKSSKTQRLTSLDALRGVAVLLMIMQHVTFWISAEPNSSWVIQSTGLLGGLAAPLFIALAGTGAALMSERLQTADRLMRIRGMLIIGFGYLMNVLTPHWFSQGSWYVLHMIGAALLLAPWLRRISDGGLILVMAVLMVVTGLLQSFLGTPYRLFNEHMGAPVQLAGLLRYALVEGFFPVFPWLAFFIAGLLAGRWLIDGRSSKILGSGALLVGIGMILAGAYASGVDFARSEPWVRYFRVQASFYSALAPLSLMLMGAALLLIASFSALQKKITFRPSNVLVCLGRASLTFLIVHVAVIRESAVHLDFWKVLPALPTLVVTAAVLIFFSLAAKAWRRIEFRYGFEWLLRRLS
jgi:uncharacterized membrane protein